MKKLLPIASVLALALMAATPALAGHRALRRGHGHRVVVRPAGHVAVIGYPYYAQRPRIGFHLSLGLPGVYYLPAPYYYAPAPVYYHRSLPVFAAPARCGFFVGAHYVWDAHRGVRVYHKGHQRQGDDDDEGYD